jgi:hypothetical protein
MPRVSRAASRSLRTLGLALALTSTIAPRVRAQDTTTTANLQPTPAGAVVVLTLDDGSILRGRVLEVTGTFVRFSSSLGESSVPRSAIRSVKVLSAEQLHGNEIWPEDPSVTRLFFAPTGRMLRKSETYFADAYVFLPSFQTGLSDRVSLGAGMSLIPGVGIENQVYYLTPKLGLIAGPNVNVAVGALVAGAGWATDQSPFGMAYGVGTFGPEDANVSVGAGFAYSRGNTDGSALLMLGGSRRMTRNIALVSENYLYTGHASSSILAGGVRFIGETLSVDLAGIVSPNQLTVPVPYVAFLYRY